MVQYSGEKVRIHVYILDSNAIISYLYQRDRNDNYKFNRENKKMEFYNFF